MKQIFIGGAGRSGTTITLHVLYKHHQIYAVPIESKFIVEVDGLSSLYYAMTDGFSPTASQEAKRRFAYLMKYVVSGKGDNPYHRAYGKQEFFLSDLFENYESEVNAFLEKISPHVFYEDKNTIISDMRTFVDNLFEKKARSLGKIAWCEKTPSNLSQIGFLYKLYRDMCFINMIRDPRGVLYSLLKLGWCNPNVEIAAVRLKETLRCLIRKSQLARDEGVNIIDIHWEDLVVHTDNVLRSLVEFLDIEPYQDEARHYLNQKLKGGALQYDRITGRYLDAWVEGFDKENLDIVNSILREEILGLGYKI